MRAGLGGYARVTLPAFRQDVHTVTRRRVPGETSARTVCTLGFHRRLVRRWEWDTDLPKPGRLPQTSHTLATGYSSGISYVGPGVGCSPGNRASVASGARGHQTGRTDLRTLAGR
jgi:hypothetical protein